MELAILILLAEHGSLAYEQIAAHLGRPAHVVRGELDQLRRRGLVDAVTVGKLEGDLTNAAAYWRLTAAGQNEVARRRDG